MIRRLLATALWYLSVWYGYEVALQFADLPRVAGPIAAAIVAGAIYLDPLHLIWPRERVAEPLSDTVAAEAA